ncbi:putative quinol monooxygenase [[Actinomadura] parvosata]|uniref:putative quinol monooxygenase n=1 Tax=[Actinomadura] parvosata TaxID=1955412 RepID=UPI00406C6469
MDVRYGFSATLTARPGLGRQLTELLLSGLDEGSPAASEHCLVCLVSRSASHPDVVHVVEGWSSEEEHYRVFAGQAAQALVVRVRELVAAQCGVHEASVRRP